MLFRLAAALLGAAIGFVVAAAILDDMKLNGAAFLLAVVIFVAVSAVLEPMIEKIGDKNAPIISALSSLITSFLALLLTDLISDGLSIEGFTTWVLATLIVWPCTALAKWILLRMFIKNRRENR